jgi:hypothetical protein
MAVPVIARQLWNRCLISDGTRGQKAGSSQAEMLGNGPRRREQVLGVSWGFEPLNALLAYGLVHFVK